MKATCWHGARDVRVEQVPDPAIINPGDAIVKISSTAICGSDLHLYNGVVPSMMQGDILGHEFMGEVVEIGSAVKRLKVGERVVVPFPIACGQCFFCEQTLFSVCENSNPNAYLAEKMWGHSTAGIFGYSHLTGGYAGGQAEYARVPFADVGPLVVPPQLPDDKVLFLSDVLPTGFMAAEACAIVPGAVVAVWGCGPVGQFAIQSAYLLGAERVIAIDHYQDRLDMARDVSHAEVLNFDELDIMDALREMTGGRGPDACIDAVGMEAHGAGAGYAYDRVKQAMRLESDRPTALREALLSCRNAGVVSIAGVYGGFSDKIPFGSVMNRGLTIRAGQCHVQRYMQPLLERIMNGDIDPACIITHHLGLDDAPQAYEMFKHKQDRCIKVVMHPKH